MELVWNGLWGNSSRSKLEVKLNYRVFLVGFTATVFWIFIRKIGRVMGVYSRGILPMLIEFAMTRPQVTRLRAAHVPAASGVVLEVGVGSGLNLSFYSKNVTTLYGLDPSEALLAKARRRSRNIRFPVQLVRGDAARLPIASASVDCVVMTWTLCSIADPAAALREVRRVTKE